MTTLVYVAGPYRATTPWLVEQNVRRAEQMGYELTCAGLYPVIPHTNTRGYFASGQQDDAFWLAGTLELLKRCDAVALVPGWESSSGARAEAKAARDLGLPMLMPGQEMAAFVALLGGAFT